MTIRIEGLTDGILARDFGAVCRDVLSFYEARVGDTPALGRKPFVVCPAPDGVPRACLDGLPHEYLIHVTNLDRRREYNRHVYQLAHEIGHHYVDPYKDSWFVESCCSAMSYLALRHMGSKWRRDPPFPNWADYAHNFGEYRDRDTREALREAGVATLEQVPTWLSDQLPGIVARGEIGVDDCGRPYQRVCGIRIEEILRAHRQAWHALCRLGEATDRERTDLGQWLGLVDTREAPLVRDLLGAFRAAWEAEPHDLGKEPDMREQGELRVPMNPELAQKIKLQAGAALQALDNLMEILAAAAPDGEPAQRIGELTRLLVNAPGVLEAYAFRYGYDQAKKER